MSFGLQGKWKFAIECDENVLGIRAMWSRNELTNRTIPHKQYHRVKVQEQSDCRLLSQNDYK